MKVERNKYVKIIKIKIKRKKDEKIIKEDYLKRIRKKKNESGIVGGVGGGGVNGDGECELIKKGK
jgi:hypothetical protein